MKLLIVSVGVISILVNIVLGILLLLATPHDWPMTPGTIKAKKVSVDGQSFVMIEGDPMNYLGQIQSINVGFDPSGKRIIVTRCLIAWNPFSKIVVNNQWPVLYPLEGIGPGKYPVVYRSSEGEKTAETIEVP